MTKVTDINKTLTDADAATDDLLYVVDVSDPTQGPSGTSAKITLENLSRKVSANLLSGSIINLADDSATSIPVPASADTGFFRLITRTVETFAVEISFRSDITPSLGGECWNLNNSRIDTTTGSLGGTTGTDNNITVSVDDGVIWVENRSGFTRSFDYLFTCVS
jgi:hypothetical protein